MVDFQSRDTRRGPPLDDEEDEPDDEGDPPDEPAADEETDTPAADEETDPPAADEETDTPAADEETDPTAADEEGNSHPADDDPDGERTDGDTVDGTGGPEAAETAAETGSPTEAPSSPTPVDEEPPSTSDGDTPATDPLDDRADAPSPAGEATATRQAGEAAATGDEGAEATATIDVAIVTVGLGEMERVEEAVAAAFEASGHTVTVRERLRGEYDTVQQVVDRLVSRADVDAVVTAGGIGIAADERTIEAVHPLFAKALPGFGEAFRALLFEEIGTGIVGVRSTAGVADGTLVFCLPGDAEAARLAVEEILVPEAPELVAHLR